MKRENKEKLKRERHGHSLDLCSWNDKQTEGKRDAAVFRKFTVLSMAEQTSKNQQLTES